MSELQSPLPPAPPLLILSWLMTRSSSVTFNTRPLKAVLDRCSHFLEAAGVKNVWVEWQCKYQQPMLLFRIITTAAGLLLALTLASLLYLQQVGVCVVLSGCVQACIYV